MQDAGRQHRECRRMPATQNTIGAPMLFGYWKDPNFNPKERAFYYIRVIEIPTPRWTTYDAKIFRTKPPANCPTSIQDRAYTSPDLVHTR